MKPMSQSIHVLSPIPPAGRRMRASEINQVRSFGTSVQPYANKNWTLHNHPNSVDSVVLRWQESDGTAASWLFKRGELGVPNFDAMDADELRDFFKTHEFGRNHLRIFPNGGAGCVRATGDLASYAINKMVAFNLREEGKVDEAMRYEAICDGIYNSLPSFSRW